MNSVGLAICLKLVVCSVIIERALSCAIFDSTDSLGVGSSVGLHVECMFDSTDSLMSVGQALSYR